MKSSWRPGQRFTPRTAWTAIRLPDEVKQELLEGFVEGVTVYRQQARVSASRPTIERFQRLLRGCIALEQVRRGYWVPGSGKVRLLPVGSPSTEARSWRLAEAVVVEILDAGGGRIRIMPASNEHWQQFIDEKAFTPLSHGAFYPLGLGRGLVVLYAGNGHVVFRKPDDVGNAHALVECFWAHARLCLWRYRRVPLRYLHLHLAELTARFNLGQEGFAEELSYLARTLPRDDVEGIIRRPD